LKDFSEAVYQFKLSTIQYKEATGMQAREITPALVSLFKRGLKQGSSFLEGGSGSSMRKYIKANTQADSDVPAFGMLKSLGKSLGSKLGFGKAAPAPNLLSMDNAWGAPSGPMFAAEGQYVNRPTLMMVGEENRGEVVIPTERIRKGLPINAGVARELGSIGVPGFKKGFWGSNYGKGSAFGEAGGFKGAARLGASEGLQAGAMGALDMWKQGGSTRQIASAGVSGAVGAGVGMAATAALTPVLGPFAPMVGGMLGQFAGKGIGKLFAKGEGHSKFRNRSLKIMKAHVASGMGFEPGIPSGLSTSMQKAVGGRSGKYNPEAAMKLQEAMMSSFTNLDQQETSGLINLMLGTERNPNAYAYFNKDFGLSSPISFAKGGVVTGPTNAVIGDAGPEAVIPLENSELVREMKAMRQATQQLLEVMSSQKTSINLDGRVLAEATAKQSISIAQGL